ncbi:hypothetical protein T11_16590 [Trichinella zimbabwensis]|uniref:Uncharacterized protein n=1 Tax=Trichinella zimbabwensis TaxID=268475 RepID=A0A0V1H3B3_9BILA|nr:hypothetical protein T11_16590 [Trichinella zimbabwensis]
MGHTMTLCKKWKACCKGDCPSYHHPLLYEDKREPSSKLSTTTNENTEQKKQVKVAFRQNSCQQKTLLLQIAQAWQVGNDGICTLVVCLFDAGSQ